MLTLSTSGHQSSTIHILSSSSQSCISRLGRLGDTANWCGFGDDDRQGFGGVSPTLIVYTLQVNSIHVIGE
uniref:Uncharacterized protein n=1 Tax=Setaria digitata TaxID=48799 RepID=A0A915PUS9_9BILA